MDDRVIFTDLDPTPVISEKVTNRVRVGIEVLIIHPWYESMLLRDWPWMKRNQHYIFHRKQRAPATIHELQSVKPVE